jgi:hypothetical protein
MTYPSGWPAQRPMESSTAYGGGSPYFTSSPTRRTSASTYCARAVLLVGLATYVVSYGAVREPAGIGWGVRFSTLAAIVAALGLLPRQAAHAKVVVALAVPAFLESLSGWLTVSETQDRRWVVIAIVVLTALQAVAASAALLTDISAGAPPDHRPAPYDPYAYYAQVAQQYYAASTQYQQDTVSAQGNAQAQSAASVSAAGSAARRDALYAEYVGGQQPGATRATSSPRAGQLAQPTPGSGLPATGPAEGVRPGFDSARESFTQSPPA